MSRQHRTILGMDRMTNVVLIILSAVSGLLTYQGLKLVFDAGAVTWLNFIVAAAMAFAITMIIYLFWRTAFKAAVTYEPGLPLGLGLSVTSLFIPFIIAISSWFNTAGMAGPAAIQKHLFVQIVKTQVHADAQITAALALQSFGPSLAQAAVGYQAEALSECSSGSRTGSGGEGTLCFTMRAVAERLTTLAADLPEQKKGAFAAAKRARAVINQMRVVVSSNAETGKKVDEVARHADQLRNMLAALNGAETLSLIRSTVRSLPDETSKRPLSAKSKAGRAKQQAALDDLHVELTRLADRVETEVDEAAPKESVALPTMERLNTATAVFRYASDFVPFWIAGIALDLMPLAILLFLVLQRSTLTAEEIAMREILNLTVKDQIVSEAAKLALRAPGQSQKAVRKTVDHALGAPDEIADRSAEGMPPKDITPKEGEDA